MTAFTDQYSLPNIFFDIGHLIWDRQPDTNTEIDFYVIDQFFMV
jgi:hypothetical protein